MNVVRDALGDGAFVPVLVLVAAVLPCSNDGRLSALGEVAGAEVGGVPPRDDVYKIDGPVAVFVLVVSLDGFVRFPMRMTLFMLALLFRKLGEPGSYLL